MPNVPLEAHLSRDGDSDADDEEEEDGGQLDDKEENLSGDSDADY